MLLDDTSKRASAGEGYQPGDNLRNSYNAVDPQDDSQSYESVNQDDFNNPEFKAAQAEKNKEKARLIDEAKKIMRRGLDRAPDRLAIRLGAPKDIVRDIKDNTPEGRERVKEFAKGKARDFAKEKIGKNIANEGIKKGFEKGVSHGAKKATQKATTEATKKAVETGVKKGLETAGKQAVSKGVGSAVGAATGVETLGVGFILGFLINVAISLYLDDAIEAASELKNGNRAEALFLFVRAGAKVGVLVWFVIAIIFMFSVVGVFISVPILIALNIYMIIGALPVSQKVPHLQGMVWWEMVALVIIDVIAFFIIAAFVGGLVYYLCQTSGLGGSGLSGAVGTVVVKVYDWWSGGGAASFANDICKQVLTP